MMSAQHAMAQTVKRADPHATRIDRQHCGNARQHFFGRFVGKRYGENAVRTHLTRLDQIRDTRCQNARFAATGAGQNQYRLVRQRDGFELLRIEVC